MSTMGGSSSYSVFVRISRILVTNYLLFEFDLLVSTYVEIDPSQNSLKDRSTASQIAVIDLGPNYKVYSSGSILASFFTVSTSASIVRIASWLSSLYACFDCPAGLVESAAAVGGLVPSTFERDTFEGMDLWVPAS